MPDPDIEEILGSLLAKGGGGMRSVGIRAEEILSSPSEITLAGEQFAGVVFAYYCWVNADQVKMTIYVMRKTLGDLMKVPGVGSDLWDAMWRIITNTPWPKSTSTTTHYTGDVKMDVALYKTLMDAYQKKLDARPAGPALSKADWMTEHGYHYPDPGNASYAKIVAWIDLKYATYLSAWDVPPKPKKPGWMVATFEEKMLLAVAGYLLASHPVLIAELVKGIGSVVQGVGQIIPL